MVSNFYKTVSATTHNFDRTPKAHERFLEAFQEVERRVRDCAARGEYVCTVEVEGFDERTREAYRRAVAQMAAQGFLVTYRKTVHQNHYEDTWDICWK